MCSTVFDTVTTLAVVTVIYNNNDCYYYYYTTIETKYRLPYDKVYFHAPKDG